MTIYSKLMPTTSTINPRQLCRGVLSVYDGRVSLRNVAQLCKVPTRAVREVLSVISEKQKSLREHHKDKLVESSTQSQITRLIGNYLSCEELSTTYTKWELEEAMKARSFYKKPLS